jgi:Rieske Fe-S protein
MSTPVPIDGFRPDRRTVVGGCAGALALCVSGCARYGTPTAQPPPAPAPAPPGGTQVAASSVPVGGGVIRADQQLVVTQPTAGTFAAFGTVCPHQGCTVNEVSDGLIKCPCHGSEFRVADGSVAAGPAPRGLTRKQAILQGGQVRVT